MPTYSYECTKCGHIQDIFHGMTASPRIKCEDCGAKCHKLLGTGAGIIFKGSGFYETDYKDKKGTPPATAKKSKSKNGSSSESKSTSTSSKDNSSKSETKSKT